VTNWQRATIDKKSDGVILNGTVLQAK